MDNGKERNEEDEDRFFLQHGQNEKNQEVKEFNGKNQDFDEGNYVKTAWFQRKLSGWKTVSSLLIKMVVTKLKT